MKATELLKEQTSVNETDNLNSLENKELVKRIEVEGTPFTIIVTENGAFLTMGAYRLTPELKDEETVREWMIEHRWDLILNLMSAVMDAAEKTKQNEVLENFKGSLINK